MWVLAVLLLGMELPALAQEDDLYPRAAELLTIPVTTNEPEAVGRMSGVANAWNKLVRQVRAQQAHFSNRENDALDALLVQVQNGLIAIGLRPGRRPTGGDPLRAIRQLVPNTAALHRFLERKCRESPGIPAFKKLRSSAALLAEETRRVVPLTAAR